MPRRTAVLVVNPRSRRGAGIAEDAVARFDRHGVDLIGVERIDGDLADAVGRALDASPDVVALAGGDGTISSAVGLLAHRDVALGVVPTGTTNNFARTLGVPTDVDAAIALLATGVVSAIDLGVAGDERFANVATLGISVDVGHHVPARLKKVLGRAAYALTGLWSLLRHRPITVHVETDRGTFRYDTHQLVVANGRFHGGMLIGDDLDPDDDHLVVFHLGDHRRVELLRSLLLFAFGRGRTLKPGTFERVQRAKVTAWPPQDLELDGEIRARTPVELGVDLESLRVVVPKAFRDDD